MLLRDITSHTWDDGGRAAAATVNWIGRDTGAPDQAAAHRAGEANSVRGPGDPVLGPEYFSPDGVLIEYDRAPVALKGPYSTALLTFATQHGQATLLGDVAHWYDEGAGR